MKWEHLLEGISVIDSVCWHDYLVSRCDQGRILKDSNLKMEVCLLQFVQDRNVAQLCHLAIIYKTSEHGMGGGIVFSAFKTSVEVGTEPNLSRCKRVNQHARSHYRRCCVTRHASLVFGNTGVLPEITHCHSIIPKLFG